MKIAVLIWADRHSDLEIELYSDHQAAIAKADRIISDHREGETAEFWEEVDRDFAFTDAMKQGGWIYYKVYSVEGDHVHIELKELLN